MKRFAGLTLLLVTGWLGIPGSAADVRLQDADLAWDRGDYPTALRGYLAILGAGAPDDVADAIALQTGELFKTTEITADGGAPRFSPDGRYFTYEVGRGASRRTRLAKTDAPVEPLAELGGYGAAFSPDGTGLAYLKLDPTSEMRELETSIETAETAERTKLSARLSGLTESAARITVRDLPSGSERTVETGTLRKSAVRLAGDGVVVFSGSENGGVEQIYVVPGGAAAAAATSGDTAKVLQDVNAQGTAVIFTHRAQGRRGAGGGGAPAQFGVLALPAGTATLVTGTAPAFSPDGRSLAFVTRTEPNSQLLIAPVATPDRGTAVRTGTERLDAPSFSPRCRPRRLPDDDRRRLGAVHGQGRRLGRTTPDARDPARRAAAIPRQRSPDRHDRRAAPPPVVRLRPRLRQADAALPQQHRADDRAGVRVGGEPRRQQGADRRGTGRRHRVAPARRLPDRPFGQDLARRAAGAGAERARCGGGAARQGQAALRAQSPLLSAPWSRKRRSAASSVTRRRSSISTRSTSRGRATSSRPAYLAETYKSFGYQPQLQWFSRPEAAGGQTANVVATLQGTVNPELVYVVSSHYDSVAIGPGADDDTSGTAALLETARMLSRHPQPATIVFASFTGEESGLLGSREFVRRAVADKAQIVGALNNDMIGWANDHRLDNTIRYSNPGIRDIQHAAAIQFSNLITYDALYYKNTDAHAYYEAYGDIVGGIGSYPVLGSPHYHQSHDTLDTINHQLIAEVAKTTAATLMLLASSPSRTTGLKVDSYQNGTAALSWTPNPEKGITGYVVAWGPAGKPESQQMRVTRPAAAVKVAPGTMVSVKAVNQRGLEGWDWARTTIR